MDTTKFCKICGKPFETTKSNKVICDREHFNRCIVCGRTFHVDKSNYTKLTCSRECMKIQMSRKLSSEEVRQKTIETSRAKYGTDSPTQSAVVKQKAEETNLKNRGVKFPMQSVDVKQKSIETNRAKYGADYAMQNPAVRARYVKNLLDAKGVENVGQLDEVKQKVQQTVLEKYGETNVFKVPEIRNRAKQTSREKYGTDVPSQSSVVKSRIEATNIKNLGVPWPFMSDEVKAKSAETNEARYGTVHPCQNSEVIDRIRATNEERWGGYTYASPELSTKARETSLERWGTPFPIQNPEIQAKREASNINKYGVPYTSQLPDTHRKASETRRRVKAVDGTSVDSFYEKYVYDFCIENGIPFEYQSRCIEYEYDGKKHSTIIDFIIDGYLVEVKGAHLLNGCFDYAHVPVDVKLGLYKKHHVIVVTDDSIRSLFGKPNSSISNGLKYLNKCPNPLIGVDISLFTNNLEFPYRADRPPCFYDVRVDGQKSIHEAFFDGQLRWKMIKNRIEYSGGFIDAKQVLTAFNVTRTCKQPSWFSKSLAKDLISKYCTSDTIVDPFAGYGARADAANELNKKYIGIDFNKSLVDWHQEQGRDCISWGDANKFKYDGDCSVFICPPYSDPDTGRCFEDYNFEGFDDAAKGLSQCDWLKIVMKNVPNAREYVMVCKIVDSDWEQFIVDTKNNRSHFGSNNEYVIRVSSADRDKALSA